MKHTPWLSLFAPPGGGSHEDRTFRILNRNGRPFLFFQDEDALATLELYAPQTIKARLKKQALKLLLQWNLFHPLGRITSPLGIQTPFAKFLAQLSSTIPLPQFGVLCGNSLAPGQKFIFTLFDACGKPTTIVKVGISPIARASVQAESRLLKSAPSTLPGLPPLLNALDTDVFSALAIPFVRRKCPPSVLPSQLPLRLSEWLRPNSRRNLREFPIWQELIHAGGPLFQRADRCLGKLAVAPTLFHGDFAPWNILFDENDKCLLIDWESGSLEGIPGWDWFHFLIQTSILVRRERPEATFRRVRAEFATPEFVAYAKLANIQDHLPPLLASYLAFACHRKQADGRKPLVELLASFDRFWPDWDQLPPNAIEPPNFPQFSIVTPSYNQPAWLKLCVASIRDQESVTLEHIIQDAGTPGMERIFQQDFGLDQSPGSTGSHAVRLVTETDNGMYDAINCGFLKSRGDIVAWLNCDEQYLPGALDKVAGFFKRNPDVDIVFGDAILVDDGGNILSYRRTILPSTLHTRLSHLNTLSCATFVRRRIVDGGFLLRPE